MKAESIYYVVLSKKRGKLGVSMDLKGAKAKIYRERNKWMLESLNKGVRVNDKRVPDLHELNKYYVINYANYNLIWRNIADEYSEELYFRDLIDIHGRISKEIYVGLITLSLGMIIGVYFLPGLIVSSNRYIVRTGQVEESIKTIAPIVHLVGFSIIAVLLIIWTVKRIRDRKQGLITQQLN